MYRLSIFSSDTLRLNPRQLLNSHALWLSALGLLLIELVVRFMMPAHLVAKHAFHTPELRQQVLQYQTISRVDMLIAGSSIAAVNYPPQTLDKTLHEQGLEGFITFNGGIRGCNYTCIEPGLKTHYLQHKQPRIVLLVVGPMDLDHSNTVVVNRSAAFVNSFEKPIYQRWVETAMSHISYLYAFDDEIRSLMVQGHWTRPQAEVLIRGHVSMGNEDRPRYQTYPSFDQGSEPVVALGRLIGFLRESNIRPIVLPDLGDSNSRAKLLDDERTAFLTALDSIAQLYDIPVLRLPENYPPDEHYIDDIHLDYPSSLENGSYLARQLLESGLLATR